MPAARAGEEELRGGAAAAGGERGGPRLMDLLTATWPLGTLMSLWSAGIFGPVVWGSISFCQGDAVDDELGGEAVTDISECGST